MYWRRNLVKYTTTLLNGYHLLWQTFRFIQIFFFCFCRFSKDLSKSNCSSACTLSPCRPFGVLQANFKVSIRRGLPGGRVVSWALQTLWPTAGLLQTKQGKRGHGDPWQAALAVCLAVCLSKWLSFMSSTCACLSVWQSVKVTWRFMHVYKLCKSFQVADMH